jgi:hypothetical protein
MAVPHVWRALRSTGAEHAPDRLPPAPLLEPGSRKRCRALVHRRRPTWGGFVYVA